MTDDLVARLKIPIGHETNDLNVERREAAARIEALEAEKVVARVRVGELVERVAALEAGVSRLDGETIRTLLDLLNPLHGALDRQTYDGKVRDNFDGPPGQEYNVNITSSMERDLTQAVVILEDWINLGPPPPAPDETPMPTDEQIEAAAKVLYDRSRRGLLDGPPSWEQAPTQAKAYYIGNAAAALVAADAVAARSVAPAGVPDGWKLVPEGDNACMGSPLDALRYVLDSWREWTKYTGPLMGLPKELDERDAREREARSRLAHAAGTLSWHLDKSPSLVAMLAAAPAPPADGWRPIETAPKGDPSRFDGPELLLGSIDGVHKGYWCNGDSQQPPGWIWDGDRDPTHWQPVPAAPPEE